MSAVRKTERELREVTNSTQFQSTLGHRGKRPVELLETRRMVRKEIKESMLTRCPEGEKWFARVGRDR